MNPLLLYKTQARVSLDEHQRDIEAVVTPLSGYDFDADEVHQNHVQLGRPEGRLAKAIAAPCQKWSRVDSRVRIRISSG
jgi:hypothetical protein